MIFNIKKALFNEVEDYLIKPIEGNFEVRVAKLKKGYYLYDTIGGQVGQIMFEKGTAKIVAPDSPSIVVSISSSATNEYIVYDGIFEDTKSVKNTSFKKVNTSEYMIYGKAKDYKYDIYEKKKDNKMPIVSANVINDMNSNDIYKIRILDAKNILKTLMICLAIDKLNLDPNSRI